jgi:hypothetical protein
MRVVLVRADWKKQSFALPLTTKKSNSWYFSMENEHFCAELQHIRRNYNLLIATQPEQRDTQEPNNRVSIGDLHLCITQMTALETMPA